jgi:hypothetical protein
MLDLPLDGVDAGDVEACLGPDLRQGLPGDLPQLAQASQARISILSQSRNRFSGSQMAAMAGRE